MAEPHSSFGVLIAGGTTSVVFVTLSAMGIDPVRMGAGLGGAIIAVTFFPPRNVAGFRLALLIFASMLLASYVGPILAPPIVLLGNKIGVAENHAIAVTCAMVGAFPKPVVVLVQNGWHRFLKKYGVQDGHVSTDERD